MAIVKNNFFIDDEVPTAAELNQPYDDAATQTADIDADNVSENWITNYHFTNTNSCNVLYDHIYDGVSEFSSSSTSYVTIDSTGSDPAEVTLNYSPDQYEVLRVEASALVTNIEADQTYDSTTATRGDWNYYAFRLLLTYNDGGASSTITLGEWGYSFTSMAGGDRRDNNVANGLPGLTGVPLGFQTVQFSTFNRYNGSSGTRTYEKIELQAKINRGTGNVLKVSRNNIIAVRARR